MNLNSIISLLIVYCMWRSNYKVKSA